MTTSLPAPTPATAAATQAPAASSQAADIALLRRFEPVLRYTRGERFFPIGVEHYVRESSLWQQRPGEEPIQRVAEGELTIDNLAEPREADFGTVQFLKFIEPLR